MTSDSALKELIPEFYYFPDFLQNCNKFSFGVKQDGERVDDVVLPPYAAACEDRKRKGTRRLSQENEESGSGFFSGDVYGETKQANRKTELCVRSSIHTRLGSAFSLP